jgi:hypothetical protein
MTAQNCSIFMPMFRLQDLESPLAKTTVLVHGSRARGDDGGVLTLNRM